MPDASATTNPTNTATDLRAKICETATRTAEAAAGTDYLLGGKTPAGFDCSGFVSYVYQQVFPDLEYMSTDAIIASDLFNEVVAYRPGDLIFFPAGTVPFELAKKNNKVFPNHVGIMVDHGHWISSQTSNGPAKVALNDVWWGGRTKKFLMYKSLK